MKTTTFIILGAALLFVLVTGGTLISTRNTLARLQVTYNMKVKANSGEFDNMWKKIQQVSQVPAEKKEALKELMASYTAGRETGKNQLMTWVQEAVPNTGALDIYDKVMNIIVGSRDSWTMRQTELVSVAEQYNAVREGSLTGSLVSWLFGYQPIDPQVITSSRTEEVFASGKDDDVELFKK